MCWKIWGLIPSRGKILLISKITTQGLGLTHPRIEWVVGLFTQV
jgi:hypothetical protein